MSGKDTYTSAKVVCAGIRRRRIEAGLTLEDLAKRAGITPNYLGAVELGKRDPSLSTLEAIANGLGIALGELFGDAPALSELGLTTGQLYDAAVPEVQKAILMILYAAVRNLSSD
jgi:XRE family transcriptional regulator, fatty acid utilization regulator